MDHNYSKAGIWADAEKRKRVTKYCSVPQCRNYYREGLGFHQFPKNKDLRKKWETALKMGKPASATMLVCSKHFVNSDYFPSGIKKRKLYPTAVPSQKLPVRPLEKCETSPHKRKRLARSDRAEIRYVKKIMSGDMDENSKSSDSELDESELPPDDPPSSLTPLRLGRGTQATLADERITYLSHEDGYSFADLIANMSQGKENFQDKATQVHLNQREPSGSGEPSINLSDILSSDAKLFTFTGIASLDMLDALVECVSEIDLVPSTNKKVRSVKDRILVTMVKIKMNISFTAIAILFGITKQTCANYFHSMCPLLAKVLEVVIPWPDQEIIRCNIPTSFENYKKTRFVLDYAETAIETCKCLKCRVLTYSQYKKKHTAKYCVGITPLGLITFISSAFGGRPSDKFIVNNSQILDKMEVNNAVIVGKGCNIVVECLERHLKLVRPPFLHQRKKLSKEDALLTAEMARARAHVERVIQRLRTYDMIKGPIPWHVAPYFNDCLVIASGLTNLGPPVMNIDKFM